MALGNDEFRLLAYLRGYADGWGDGNSLDPGWVAGQLEFDVPRMRQAARGLAELGLVTLLEFQGETKETLFYADPTGGPVLVDIAMTERGWNHLAESPTGV